MPAILSASPISFGLFQDGQIIRRAIHCKPMFLNFNKMVLISASLCMTGCSTFFNPTVGMLAPYQTTADAPENMPALTAVVKETNSKIQLIENKRNSSLQTNRILGVTTFGLGLAAAGYGLYSSHAHAMKNLALASGATYVGSSLFAPIRQTEIYHAGIQALSCINDKASRTLTQIDRDIKNFNTTPPLSYSHCKPNIAQLARQNSAFEKVTWSANNAKSSDGSLAQTARSASNNVLQELDKQLIGLTPSPDAILNAAKTLLPSGGLGATAISSDQVRAAAAENGLRSKSTPQLTIPDCGTLENSRLDERAANYQAITNSLTAAMNYMDELSSACVMSEKTIAPVMLSQYEVTITKDIKFVNVVISGGREPYLLTKSDTPGVIVNIIQPRTINIIKETEPATGTYTIEIRDSSTVTTPKILTIHAK